MHCWPRTIESLIEPSDTCAHKTGYLILHRWPTAAGEIQEVLEETHWVLGATSFSTTKIWK